MSKWRRLHEMAQTRRFAARRRMMMVLAAAMGASTVAAAMAQLSVIRSSPRVGPAGDANKALAIAALVQRTHHALSRMFIEAQQAKYPWQLPRETHPPDVVPAVGGCINI